MKMKTLLSTAVLAVVALALTAPAVGQSLRGPGMGVTWTAGLHGITARSYGTAQYETFRATVAPPSTAKGKLMSKFTVESVTPAIVDGTMLDVFVGPGTTAGEPYGKLVGTIDVEGGFGTMVLFAAKTPSVEIGTTVTIIEH